MLGFKNGGCGTDISGLGMAALALAIAGIFYLGILPTPVLNLAADSIATIF